MKKIIILFIILCSTISAHSQTTFLPKTQTKGNLQEVTVFYENGNIMQHGFYTKEGKLHGAWESYNLDGSKKCDATYNNGAKVGTWTYWNQGKITKIEYDNDKVVKIEEFDEKQFAKKAI